ncbi:MAG: CapA family protein, partial [Myxococcales bacterium]|nr:CapA family protein [Myxococcales bacterium]
MLTIRHTTPVFLAGILAFVAVPTTVQAYQFDDDEAAYRDLYLATAVELVGRVVDEQGMGLDGAQLRLIGFGEGLLNDGEATDSWSGGSFSLAGLARRSVLLEVSLDGYYTEIIPVDLHAAIDEDQVDVGDVRLVARQFGRARMTFGGDVMFGRRMLDHDEDGVLGEAGDVLHLPTLGADTTALFRFVEPLLFSDDHTAVNLETPVTDNPATPHPTKSYVFHAYSGSVAVLPDVGIDSVSLGNNHVYDYLEGGMNDTLMHLDNLGITYYGAGV